MGIHGRIVAGVMLLLASGFMACDTLEPVEEPRLVVTSFFNAGELLPQVVVRKTGALNKPYAPNGKHAVGNAQVTLQMADRKISYQPSASTPGVYLPADARMRVAPQASFKLEVQWQKSTAWADSRVPPLLAIDSFNVEVSDQAVEAVFADSLGPNLQRGFLYPVDVTLWWTDSTQTRSDSLYWIHAQINPPSSFPSAVVGYFLRTSAVFPEAEADKKGLRRKWTGVYGVPVPSATSKLPPHKISVYLLRSGTDYARFATSRKTPERREPISNVSNGRGIVAGTSMDSLEVQITINGGKLQ